MPSTPVMFPQSSMLSAIGRPRFGATPTIVDQFFCDFSRVFTKNAEYCDADNLGVCKPFTRGRIFFPKSGELPLPGPIVVFCHGQAPLAGCNIPFYRGFDRLLKCIASNGMIAVSIECSNDDNQLARANRILQQLARIKSVIASKGVALAGSEPLALVGHSNGGEAVALAGEAIRSGAIKNSFAAVQAVVQLSPSYNPGQTYSLHQYTKNHLVIHAALDGNVAPLRGVSHYEDAFSIAMIKKQGTTNSIQSLIYLLGGSHTGFSDAEWNNACGASFFNGDFLTLPERVNMLKYLGQSFVVGAYVAGFLRMALKSDSALKPWFTGDVIPTFQHPIAEVQADWNAKGGVHVLHAEASGTIVLCASASCAIASGLQVLTQINMSSFSPCHHNRSGFRVEWDRGKNSSPALVFNFPEINFPTLQNRFLEFDAAQPPGSLASLEIRVAASPPLNSVFVPVSVPAQQPVILAQNQNMVLTTHRIPMSAFPVTASSFGAVVISFAKSVSKGSMLISFPRISL